MAMDMIEIIVMIDVRNCDTNVDDEENWNKNLIL